MQQENIPLENFRKPQFYSQARLLSKIIVDAHSSAAKVKRLTPLARNEVILTHPQSLVSTRSQKIGRGAHSIHVRSVSHTTLEQSSLYEQKQGSDTLDINKFSFSEPLPKSSRGMSEEKVLQKEGSQKNIFLPKLPPRQRPKRSSQSLNTSVESQTGTPPLKTSDSVLKPVKLPPRDTSNALHHIKFHWIGNRSEEHFQQTKPIPVKDSTMVGINLKTFLFGGATENGLSNELWIYNTFKEKWKVRKSDDLPGRSGHSAVVVKNQMYVFGGEVGRPHDALGYRQLSNAIYCYNLKLNHWNHVVPSPSSTQMISARKYHAACNYKNVIFIYGGIGQNGTALNDIWVFDLGFNVIIAIKLSHIDF